MGDSKKPPVWLEYAQGGKLLAGRILQNPAEVPEKATELIGSRVKTLQAKERMLQRQRQRLEDQITKAQDWKLPVELIPAKTVVAFATSSLAREREKNRRDKELSRQKIRDAGEAIVTQ